MTNDKLSKLPHTPGIYKFFDKNNTLIYIGKAKDIKKRVISYFNKSSSFIWKTQKLISQIEDIEYTIVDSEYDAFLLENNLIKKHQPKYNIQLKDDKSYPYICVTNERFSRVFSLRNIHIQPHDGTFYGPYSSIRTMHTILELVNGLYKLRTCKYNLSEQNINKKKYKLCLEYHIGNCKGPCESLQSEEEYNENIFQIKNILKGHFTKAISFFKLQMQKAAKEYKFEKAQRYKEKLNFLNKYQSKSLVVNQKIYNLDVFTIISNERFAYINYLKIVNGSIIHTKTIEVKKKLNETDVDILVFVIIETICPPLTPSPSESEKRGIGETERRKTKRFTDSPIRPFTDTPASFFDHQINNEIITNIPVEIPSPPLTSSPPESEKRGIEETENWKTKRFTDSPIHPFTDSVSNSGWRGPVVPKRGDKKKLIDLSLKNAYYIQNMKQQYRSARNNQIRVLKTFQNDLKLKSLPIHIECFDNSNIQGKNAVASMVCFKNGIPSKKDYRHFNIRSVTTPNDFASMKEIVYRRYKRFSPPLTPNPPLIPPPPKGGKKKGGRIGQPQSPPGGKSNGKVPPLGGFRGAVNLGELLPQLIIIDGGKGQLSAATEALKTLKIYGKIAIIGIAKKLEEIYFPEDSIPLHIDKRSETLKLIQKIRNEAHRFAIQFHRKQRSKAQLLSSIIKIDGIGNKTMEKLLIRFKSQKKITEATLEEISEVIGRKKAGLIKRNA